MIIDKKLEEIMSTDIERCQDAQKSAEGSHQLFQTLISKYDGIFEGFKKGIEVSGKIAPAGTPLDFRPEINAIKEKLELLLTVNESKQREKDSLFDFKKKFKEDAQNLGLIINTFYTQDQTEVQEIYNRLIARYSNVIPNFSNNVDGYRSSDGYYFKVEGEQLRKNLKNIYDKMNLCIDMNFTNLLLKEPNSQPFFQINNNNQNIMKVNLTFKELKEKTENITSLKDEEIDEVLNKIDEIETILNSSERKNKKWEKVKEIITWLLDKGVDVAIQLIPSILSKFN